MGGRRGWTGWLEKGGWDQDELGAQVLEPVSHWRACLLQEEVSSGRLRGRLASMENKMELAAQQAARAELLLPEEPG